MSQKNLTKRTVSSSLWMIIGKTVQAITQLLVITVLARILNPNDFGVVTAALVVINFSIIFSSLGVGPALIQKANLRSDQISAGFILSLTTGMIITVIIYNCSDIIAEFFDIKELSNVLKILSLTFLIQGFYIPSLSLLERELRFKSISLVNVMAYTVGYGAFSLVLALQGYGVYSLVIGQIVQEVIKFVSIIFLKRVKFNLNLTLDSFTSLMNYGAGMTIANIFNFIAVQGDNFVVGKMLGASSLGIYGRIYQLMSLPANLFGQVVDKVLFSSMSKVQSDQIKMRYGYEKALSLIAFFILPLSVFCYINSETIVLILLGDKWISAVIPFQLFTIGMFFRISYKISETIARATGAVYRRAWRQSIYALLVIVGSIIGQNWGINGVIIAVNIALIANFLLMAQLSLSILNINWSNFFKIHMCSLNSSLMLLIVLSIFNYSGNNILIDISVNFLSFVLLYIFLLTIYPKIFLGQSDWIFNLMKKHIKKIPLKKLQIKAK